MPGILVSYSLKFDLVKSTSYFNGYFISACIGYTIGLLLALIFGIVYEHAQVCKSEILKWLACLAVFSSRNYFTSRWTFIQAERATRYLERAWNSRLEQ